MRTSQSLPQQGTEEKLKGGEVQTPIGESCDQIVGACESAGAIVEQPGTVLDFSSKRCSLFFPFSGANVILVDTSVASEAWDRNRCKKKKGCNSGSFA